eukprot:scaffold100680_cov37-Attheya_sp.AAC.1
MGRPDESNETRLIHTDVCYVDDMTYIMYAEDVAFRGKQNDGMALRMVHDSARLLLEDIRLGYFRRSPSIQSETQDMDHGGEG